MFAKPSLNPKAGLLASLLLVLLAGCAEETAPEQVTAQPAPIEPQAEEFETLEVLLDFDAPELAANLEANGALTKRIRDEQGNPGGALEMRFLPEAHQPVVRLLPDEPWDWSDEDEIHIALDAHNPGNESVQLYMSLVRSGMLVGNRSGSANRAVNLAPGESGTYYAVLDGRFIDTVSGFKRSSPPPWDTGEEMFIFRFGERDLPLDEIAELSFFVRGNLTEKTIVVDNIRLRRNPEYDDSYLQGFVDEFGQNARMDYPIKVHSLEELQKAAQTELAQLDQSGLMADRSRWGGWKDGPKFEATGYFRTLKTNGKWWLVDPDGYLFFSHGPANVRMANLTTVTGIDFHDDSVRYIDPEGLTPEDSMGIVQVSDEVRATRYVASDIRHGMFNWLPEYDDPLADHYSYRRSVLMGALPHGETFSFYRANLERRYGETEPESYVRKWEDVTLARMNDWGFTSFGNWVDPAFYPNEKVPYFANGWIIGDFKTLSSKHDVWSPMPDFFDPEFVRRAEITIKRIADEIQGSPWCVGVFVDNEKSWGQREGTVEQRYGVIVDGLSRDANESPAKAAFTRHLNNKYGDIAALNQAWGTAISDWDAFAAGVSADEFNEAAIGDLSELLELLSEEYFKVVHSTLEKYLPNHLYMGARMANWGMPDETIKASVKYSDVLSFNIYEEGIEPGEWAFLQDIDLPVVVGEWHVGAVNETGLYHPGLVMAHDQADRAGMYRAYMDSLLAHPNFVGAHWFQYIDSPITGRAYDGENYNVGFVSVTDIPYPEMVDAIKDFNSTVYPRRYGEND